MTPQRPIGRPIRVGDMLSVQRALDDVHRHLEDNRRAVNTLSTSAGTSSSTATSGRDYRWNVLDHGLKGDGSTNETPAMRLLLDTVIRDGGGTIFFPEGDYLFLEHTDGATVLQLERPGDARLVLLGCGPASRLLWGRDRGGSDLHFLQVEGRCAYLELNRLYIVQRELYNPDIEHHHHIALHNQTDGTGDIEEVRIRNCLFGMCIGDAVNCQGECDVDAVRSTIAASDASGAIAGPFTSPARPQRLVVKYRLDSDTQDWDGGDITVTGTDRSGMTITETIPAKTSGIRVGELRFATVTSATKSATGVSTARAHIGIALSVRDVHIEDCTFDGFLYGHATDPQQGFRSVIGVQRLTECVTVRGNWMTGCHDQFIDFEPSDPGNLGPWIVEDNDIVVDNARTSDGQAAALAVTFDGNSNPLDELLRRSSFSWNRVWGGRVTVRYAQDCRIQGNLILTDDIPSTNAGSALSLPDRQWDVDVLDNLIITRPNMGSGHGIKVTGDSAGMSRNVRIEGNTVHWHASSSLEVESGAVGLVVRGNRFVYEGSTAATVDGVVFGGGLSGSDRCVIDDNTFEGGRGGGSIRRAIAWSCGAVATTGLSVRGNRGTDVANIGVLLNAANSPGTYSGSVHVQANSFPGAVTPTVFLGDTVIAAAGNEGGWRMLRGTGSDPNVYYTNHMYSASLGTLYQGNSGSLYTKVISPSTGAWATVTHS